MRPRSAEEVVAALRRWPHSVCVGGGRYSMGGQIAARDALHLDMRAMNRVIWLDVPGRVIRVQAGITWRDLREAIDPHDLSVKVMQSYSNFTVGGSVSVNCHGRYVGKGALIGSVRALQVVTAGGDMLELSRARDRELFGAVLQGYFIPAEAFAAFAAAMASILRAHGANALKVSIRHAPADRESLLTWAPGEVFTFVLYPKQRRTPAASAAVTAWTRELIEAALAAGGRFYLPYRLEATPAQFDRAYPQAGAFAALRARLDPRRRLRNLLWDKYLRDSRTGMMPSSGAFAIR